MKKDIVSINRLHTADRQPADRCPGFITDLILRCAARDEPALGSLFDHLYPVVHSIVASSTPAGAADALVLATFSRLWDQAPSYDPKLRQPVEWAVSQARAVRAEFLLATAPLVPSASSSTPSGWLPPKVVLGTV